ncbi:hypothetical protein Y032_0018g3578 [Ancylostoma ceylanicum]|uniref:Tetratricopeptide repeat protein n=1 Tax=Ancylostoma ceylanicum TaxID=53326 RepID=A0A016V331_9BILA|nr:hypothetical protein Y032_0018g3578 [Ancylostoma ceylanicum]
MDSESSLRRSLRRINPFRNKLFRLPATPRLARNRKVGNGEDVTTEWNFERASFRRNERPNGLTNTGVTASNPVLDATMKGPPNPAEAELNIHQHMQNLLVSSGRQSHLARLPSTSYRADGQISDAYWFGDIPFDRRSNNSTISLLNTSHRFARDSRNGTMMSTASIRKRCPVNGIQKSVPVDSGVKRVVVESRLQPLFDLDQFCPKADLEEAFIGREWAFREIYESAVVDKIPVTIVEGCRGSGKSSIINQLILNSSFYSSKTSDTIDSGCVPDDGTMYNSRNYEWMRAVATRLVAFHICNIQSSSSCSIPEFVCNLGAWLSRSPILKSYAEILTKNEEKESLLKLEECIKHDALHVFCTSIAEPLLQLNCSDQGCLVIAVDGTDEAEFHRSEDGRSIATFICNLVAHLPPWVRFIVSCNADTSLIFDDIMTRRIRLDDIALDERVVRDSRMLVDYRLSMVPELDNHLLSNTRRSIIDPFGDLIDRIVYAANGNVLYIRLLIRLVETGRLPVRYLMQSNLPMDDIDLYGLIMELTFTSPSVFARVVPVLNVFLASLRPLDRNGLLSVLNAAHSDVPMIEAQLDEILTILTPLLSFNANGSITFHDTAVRDWLLKNANHPKYCSDARHGHILLALHLTELAPLNNAQTFELTHHLLKAHPYKYMHGKYIPEFTSSKDGQVHWVKRCSSDIKRALLNQRNMFYPNTKVTRLLFMAGAEVNAVDPASGLTALHKAVAAGNAHLVSLLLSQEEPIQESQELIRKSPVSCLISHLKKRPWKRRRSLSAKSIAEKVSELSRLVTIRFKRSTEDLWEESPSVLTIAAEHGHMDLMPLLMPLDAMKTADKALEAGARNGHVKVIRYLLAQKWLDEEQRRAAIENAMVAAAGAGQTEVCEQLVDAYDCHDFAKAMCAACEHGRADTVQFFLSRGASLSTMQWPPERPALICAVESGSWDLVVAVLALPNCDLECRDAFGRTPVIAAARCAHVGLIDMLVNKGANINQRDENGWTALMHAVHKNHLPSVQLLLDRDAEITGKDKNGKTLAHIACATASRSIVDRLLEAGMLIEEADNDGLYPLQVAIQQRNKPALEALLGRGARLRSTTWQTAIDSYPEALFVLFSKLLDDAGILFRKKRFEDAMHRLHYALNKCEMCSQNEKLLDMQCGLIKARQQIIISMARVLRRQGRTQQAIEICSTIDPTACEQVRFESLLLRAKCHFDLHDIERAKANVRAAIQLRPDHDEARHLLNTLMLPCTNIARL